jgi:hypothetical protein
VNEWTAACAPSAAKKQSSSLEDSRTIVCSPTSRQTLGMALQAVGTSGGDRGSDGSLNRFRYGSDDTSEVNSPIRACKGMTGESAYVDNVLLLAGTIMFWNYMLNR